jgi:hypothetical protein
VIGLIGRISKKTLRARTRVSATLSGLSGGCAHDVCTWTCADRPSQLCASTRAHVHNMDLARAANKYEARYLIGDAAKGRIACGHWAGGEAKRFETRLNRSRVGIRTPSLIRGKWYPGRSGARFDTGADEKKGRDPNSHRNAIESTRTTK